jgi:hypothetical protein
MTFPRLLCPMESKMKILQAALCTMFILVALSPAPCLTQEKKPTILQSIEKQNPKAKSAKPEEFYDNRLVKELDQSGFIKSLLP